MTEPKPEPVIVCAALRNAEGNVVCGPRHFDLMMRQQIRNSIHPASWPTAEQGFVDQYGNFLNRVEAKAVAEKAGQIIKRVGGDEKELFSENLY